MRRRQFIVFAGAAVAASSPFCRGAAQADDSEMPRIGFLHSESAALYVDHLRAFRSGLQELGYAEDRNVVIEYRWADSHYERLPALAADLVSRRVAVIAVNGPAIQAAKAATPTIPIVFFAGGDPVKLGFVASLSRPGGNLTGVTNLGVELGPKRLELLHGLVPAARSAAVLINPSFPGAGKQADAVATAARALNVELHVLQASQERDFDDLFAILSKRQTGGLVIVTDPFFNSQQERLAALALRHSIPAIYHNHEFIAAGGLAGYGNSSFDLWRQIGTYAGRILKGEKPADLPVQQPTRFELLVNVRTAKTLGLTIPPSLLATADEVIE